MVEDNFENTVKRIYIVALWVKSQEDQCLSFLPENAHLSSFLEGGEKFKPQLL